MQRWHCPIFNHPGLTRVRGIRFLLFALVYNLSAIFKLTDLIVYYFLFKTYMPTKKVLKKKKAEKLCLIAEIVIESHSFLEY